MSAEVSYIKHDPAQELKNLKDVTNTALDKILLWTGDEFCLRTEDDAHEEQLIFGESKSF